MIPTDSMDVALSDMLVFVVAALAGIGVAVLAAVVTLMALRPIQARRRADRLARAQRDFHRQREQLEAKFIEHAASSGKPRGLRWVDVDFDDDVFYARDRRSQGLKALVAIEVSFEAAKRWAAGTKRRFFGTWGFPLSRRNCGRGAMRSKRPGRGCFLILSAKRISGG